MTDPDMSSQTGHSGPASDTRFESSESRRGAAIRQDLLLPHHMQAPEGGGGPMPVATANRLHFKHFYDMLRRHARLIAGLGILFPLLTLIYDTVLNHPLLPRSLRIGPTRQYSVLLEAEHLETDSRKSNRFQGILQQISELADQFGMSNQVSIHVIFRREKFHQILVDRLAAKAATWPAAKREEFELQREALLSNQEQGGDGIRFQLSAMKDNRVTIAVVGSHPELLLEVAREIVPALNNYGIMLRAERIQGILTMLENQSRKNALLMDDAWIRLRDINEQLTRKEKVEYKKQNLVVTNLEKSLFDLEWEIQAQEVELRQLKEKTDYDELCGRFGMGSEADIAKVIADTPLRRAQAELEQKLNQARMRYLDLHPAVQQILHDIQENRDSQMRENGATSLGILPPLPSSAEVEVLRQIDAKHHAIEVNRLKRTALSERLQAATKMLHDMAVDTDPSDTANLSTRREEVHFLLTRLRESSLKLDSDMGELRFLHEHFVQESEYERIVMDSSPRKTAPKVMLHLFMAAFIGIAMGGAIAYVQALMDNTIKTPSDVYYHLNINFLGGIPLWDTEHFSALIHPEAPNSIVSETYAHLCNNIRYGDDSHPEKCLLVASASQNEGKSTIAANLAIRYSLEGNSVLLVDADMRRPSVARLLDYYLPVPGQQKGLFDYLNNTCSMEDIVVRSSIPRLDAVLCGQVTANLVKLLSVPLMLEFLDRMQAQYDVVIIDSPAILPVVDAVTIAPKMRGILLVMAANEISIEAARMALYRLEYVNAPITGAVLNKVADHADAYPYYYSGSGHFEDED